MQTDMAANAAPHEGALLSSKIPPTTTTDHADPYAEPLVMDENTLHALDGDDDDDA